MLTFMATRLESPTGAPTPYASGSGLSGADLAHHMDFLSYLKIQVMAWNFRAARYLVGRHLRHLTSSSRRSHRVGLPQVGCEFST